MEEQREEIERLKSMIDSNGDNSKERNIQGTSFTEETQRRGNCMLILMNKNLITILYRKCNLSHKYGHVTQSKYQISTSVLK